MGDGTYTLEYSQTGAGLYYLSLTLNGEAMTATFTATITPADALASNSYIDLTNFVAAITAGVSTSLDVILVDVYGNVLTTTGTTPDSSFVAQVSSESSTSGSAALLPSASPHFMLLYSLTQTGQYSVALTFQGEHVSGSPLTVSVTPAELDPTAFQVVDSEYLQGQTFSAGTTITFQVVANDRFGNVISDVVDADTLYAISAFGKLADASVIAYTISAFSAGAWTVSQTLTTAGSYDTYISVTVSGTDVHVVEPSPFLAATIIIPLSELSIALTELSGSGLKAIACSDEAPSYGSVTITPYDRYGNQLTSDVSVDSFSVVISDIDYSYFTSMSVDVLGRITYTLTYQVPALTEDIYVSVSVYYQQSEVLGTSPYTVFLESTLEFSAASSTAEGTGVLTGFVAGQTVSFSITPRSLSGTPMLDDTTHTFTATLTLSDKTTEELSLMRDTDGTTIGAYTMTSTAPFTLAITSDGVHISGSPFSLAAIPAATSASQTTVALTSSSNVVAGSTVEGTITPRDAYANAQVYDTERSSDNFVAALSGPASVTGTITLSDNLYQVSFVPTLSGTYTASIFLCPAGVTTKATNKDSGCTAVSGSGFTVSVSADATSASNSQATGTGLSTGGAGSVRVVTLYTYDRFGNPTNVASDLFQLSLSGPQQFTNTSVRSSSSSTSHSVAYTLQSYGTYQLVIQQISSTSGESLGQVTSRTVTIVAGAPSASTTEAQYPASAVSAGVVGAFTVLARDQFGNLIGDNTASLSVQLRATTRMQADFRAVSVSWAGNGTYTVTYSTTRSGTYTASITLAGVAISNSNQPVEIAANTAVASTSTASFSSPITASATTDATMTLIPRDIYGNTLSSAANFAVSYTGPSTPESVSVSASNNQASYALTVAGTYSFSVLLDDTPISGSPYTLIVNAAELVAANTLVELNVTEDGQAAGVTQGLLLTGIDSFGNAASLTPSAVTASISMPSAGVSVTPVLSQISTTQVMVSYKPTVAGSYEISTSVSSVQVYATTFTVVHAALDPATCLVSRLSDSVLAAGSTTSYLVQMFDAYGNAIVEDPSARVSGTVSSTVLTSVLPLSTAWSSDSQAYESSITLTASSTYRVRFTVNDIAIRGSPLDVIIIASTTAASVTTYYGSGVTGGVQDEPLSVIYQLYDQYGNRKADFSDSVFLTLTQVTPAGSDSELILPTSPLGSGQYSVTYTISGLSVTSDFEAVLTVNGVAVSSYPSRVRIYSSSSQMIISPTNTVLTVLDSDSATAGNNVMLRVEPRTEDGVSLSGAGCLNSASSRTAFSMRLFRDDMEVDPTAYFASDAASCYESGGYYEIPMLFTVAASYRVQLTFSPYVDSTGEVSGSPATFSVAAGASVSSMALVSPVVSSDALTAGSTYEVNITSRDSYGNIATYDAFAGADPYTATVGSLSCDLTDNQDSTYSLSCPVQVSGTQTLSVMWDTDLVIHTSSVSVIAGVASATHSVASGVGLYSAIAGVSATFSVTVRDSYGNTLEANRADATPAVSVLVSGSTSALSSAETTIMASSSSSAVFTVSVILTTSGSYDVVVTLASSGDVIAHDVASQALQVGAASSSAAQTLVAAALTTVTAGDAVIFTVTPRDAYGNIQASFVDRVQVSAVHVASSASFTGAYLSGSTFTAESSSASFSSTSGAHTVSFTTVPSGTYTISVYVNNVLVSTSTVSSISALQQAPPTLTSIKMTNSLVQLSATFSAATNRARKSGYFSCEQVLQSSVVDMLGSGPQCVFTSDTILTIYLGAGATILPDVHSVALLENTIYSRNENSYAVSSLGLVLSRPDSAVKPQAVLIAPSEVSLCDDLDALDLSSSTGGGGRAMLYSYSVDSSASNYAEIYAYLSAQSADSDSVVVPSALLEPGFTYTFSGQVTDFLGQSSSTSVPVYKASLPQPKVLAEAHAITLSSDADGYVKVSVKLAACATDNQMSWEWTQIWTEEYIDAPDVTATPFATYRTQKDLILLANTLTPGFTYVFKVTGSMTNEPEQQSSDIVYVTVTYPAISVSIEGGSRLVAGSFNLSALACDPAFPTEDCYPDRTPSSSLPRFSYVWTCSSSSEESCSSDIDFLNTLASDSAMLTIPAVLAEGEYVFSVSVTEATEMRIASSTVTLTVDSAEAIILDVSIDAITSVKQPVNAAAKTSFEGIVSSEVSSSVQYVWKCLEGDLAVSQQDLTVQADVLASSPYSSLLVIRENMLTPGMTYTLELEVSDSATGGYGFALIEFSVNSPPTSGQLIVSSKTSDSAEYQFSSNDTVQIRTKGWIDDSSNSFTYVFGYFQGSIANGDNGVEVIMKESQSNTLNYRLPVGEGENGTLTLFVDVYDEYDAKARAIQVISISNPEMSSEESANVANACLSSELGDAKGTGDADKAASLAVSCGSLMSSSKSNSNNGNGNGKGNSRRLLADEDEEDPRVAVRRQLAQSLLSTANNVVYIAAMTPGQFLSAASQLSAATDQLSDAAFEALIAISEKFTNSSLLKVTGGMGSSDQAASINLLSDLIAYSNGSVNQDSYLQRIFEQAQSLGVGMAYSLLCGEAGVSTVNEDATMAVLTGRSQPAASALSTTALGGASIDVLPSSSTDSSCLVPLLTLYTESPYDGSEAATTTFNIQFLTDAASSSSSSSKSRARTLLQSGYTSARAMLVTVARTAPPASNTRPECQYRDPLIGMWASSDSLCSVVSATTTSVTVSTPYAGDLRIMDVVSQCSSKSTCQQCNAQDGCGWCDGKCVEGNSQGAFYATCPVASDWSYDSCPCTTYTSCSSCLSSTDSTDRTKQECGWCPETASCHSGSTQGPSDGASCPSWNVNWVHGFDASCPVACADSCNGNGACVNYTTCSCDAGWTGDRCDTPVCDPLCVNGLCVAPDTCACEEGWSGVLCEEAQCDVACVHGACTSTPNVCECETGYEGTLCDSPICSTPCGYNQYCSLPETCECNVGWSGFNCSTPNCECGEGATCVSPGQCECNDGYVLSEDGSGSCSPFCSEECPTNAFCSEPEVCTCYDGFGGANCTVRTDCYGHGVFKSGSGTCHCDAGFTGTSCQTMDCPGEPDCSEHGECVLDTLLDTPMCVCNNGYYGSTCTLTEEIYLEAVLTLEGDVADYTQAVLTDLRSSLAAYLQVSENDVEIVSVESGSVKVTTRVYSSSLEDAESMADLLAADADDLSVALGYPVEAVDTDILGDDAPVSSSVVSSDASSTASASTSESGSESGEGNGNGDGDDDSERDGAISGGVVGGFVGCVVVILGVRWVAKRKVNRSKIAYGDIDGTDDDISGPTNWIRLRGPSSTEGDNTQFRLAV
eukprot:TRINITY_DN912_c0_g1::TRINITY_DN912_c0_g1_i1::g.16014::m.16014 TRINITY_DN912_c0_g1::TRINITY_DN912_c0_g1_i1::g.16014  ORF type:complete len:3347 (+),score=1122.88,sp/P24821/TENA_HUMAN/32.68/3e-33,sp/P24821/TENA_HUMAN/32.58/1e-28,sp/P24821/TENA_HUMAN/36.25/2e-16,Filamin/PF00630.14/0.2,Filamin/PF00630.14/0.037,Filamin/PF00630.14/1.2e+02,Filamin/PF00630.14/0.88,Filamin/PF00630.14/2.3e-06,Filamin/PF00630.14/8.9,Filamin/PF00630.14/0.0016,Filamin/PF00630.14/1.4e-06,Filamin/PF00630.14/0.0098,Filamin/PF00